MQERPTEAKSPQRRRADLLAGGRGLLDPITSRHIVQQQIGEERHRAAVEQRIRARSRCQGGDVA